jgi:aarF domain-containing kinase
MPRTCTLYCTAGVDVGAVLRGSLDLVRQHSVRIDVNYATLMMNVLCLDGLARDILPEYNVLDGAKPLLQAYKVCSAGPARLLLRAVLPLAQVRLLACLLVCCVS